MTPEHGDDIHSVASFHSVIIEYIIPWGTVGAAASTMLWSRVCYKSTHDSSFQVLQQSGKILKLSSPSTA